MNMTHVHLVYRKELLDTLRDRRTLYSMIVVPLFVMPLVVFGMAKLTSNLRNQALREQATVMLLGAENAPQLAERIRKTPGITIVPATADYGKQIENKELRAAIEFPPDFETRLAGGDTRPDLAVKIYYYEGEMRSGFAVRSLQKVVGDYRDELVQQRLAARNLSADLLQPFATREENVASPQKVGGAVLGGLIPYMIILLTLTGAMYPAIDLTAGEKERGTIETILASPVSRAALTAGKFLTVLTAALATALLSLMAMAATLRFAPSLGQLGDEGDSLQIAVSGTGIAAVLCMILPVAVMFSAALLAIALAAKSFKEAQSYISPLMIVVILPAVSAMLPGVELDARLALVPILNVSLVSKEILSGTYHWNLILLILLSSTAYAAVALAVAVAQFRRESVLFRT